MQKTYQPFTAEMKAAGYTILVPNMLPMHFRLLLRIFGHYGYNMELLTTTGRHISDTGLKYVHNDTCYPAILVIGQFIDALQSGKYDPHKVALMLFQTGGGCRASNYISLLRKALQKAGYGYVPVISFSFAGIEKHPGFRLTLPMIYHMLYAVLYADLLMSLVNQVRPYEDSAGDTTAKVEFWTSELLNRFDRGEGMSRKKMRGIFEEICADFKSIPVTGEEKVRVGVVGEIYIKFSSLGNNQLEQFLLDEGAEPVVPGLTDFLIFKIYNRVSDVEMFGGSRAKQALCKFFMGYVEKCQLDMIGALKNSGFRAPGTFAELHQLIYGYLNDGCKMGEGWLLTAEMLELIHSGTPNIVCAQPFGCLPNHIVGKGMIRVLKDDYPDSNIVAVDYDPGATKINQENRIKLMLANAKRRAAEEKKAGQSAAVLSSSTHVVHN